MDSFSFALLLTNHGLSMVERSHECWQQKAYRNYLDLQILGLTSKPFFKKMGQSRPLSCIFSVFIKQTLKCLQHYMVKKWLLVSSDGI